MRLLVLLAVISMSTTAHAQDAATAASWAQTFLSGVTSLDAEFQQDSWVRVQAHTTTTHGRLRAGHPQRVRLDYHESGLIVVAHGDDFVWYQPGDGTWPGQYTRGTNDAVSAAFGVLVAGAALDHDYAVSTCGSVSATAPTGTTCIELRPRATQPPFERIRLYVLTAEDVRGRPARIAVELHDGTWNTFTFRELHVSPSIDASVFAFEPPAGTREMPTGR
jgi:outer membrane lipoprotein-sorting protein